MLRRLFLRIDEMKFKEWVAGVVAALKGCNDDLNGLSQKQAALTEYIAKLASKVNAMADAPVSVDPDLVLRVAALESQIKDLSDVAAQLDGLPPL